MVHIVEITDPADERIADFRHLNSSDRRPDLPGGKGLVIAEGVLVVQRMIDSRFTPHTLMGTESRLAELRGPGGDGLDGVDAPFHLVTPETMERCIGFHLNRGVLAAAHRPAPLPIDQALAGAETVIALEGVNDHENIGAIFRGAAGLGAQAVLFGAGCADPLYRRTVRVSMGHVLRVPFAHAENWPGALDRLRDRGYTVVSLTPDPAAPTLAGALAPLRGRPVVLLVGAEGPGLAERTMRRTDVRARIPMTPGADSLNVATAATLACYERARPV